MYFYLRGFFFFFIIFYIIRSFILSFICLFNLVFESNHDSKRSQKTPKRINQMSHVRYGNDRGTTVNPIHDDPAGSDKRPKFRHRRLPDGPAFPSSISPTSIQIRSTWTGRPLNTSNRPLIQSTTFTNSLILC